MKKHFLNISILLTLLLMYFKPLIGWVNEWIGFDSFYSYGLFLPVFLFYYFRKHKTSLTQINNEFSPIGYLVLVIGVVFYVLGIKAEYPLFVNISLPVVISGMVLLIKGYEYLKLCLIPLIMLTICLPIIPIIRITTPLQLFFSVSTVKFLHMLGVESHNIGSIVYLKGNAISVEPGCSGLKSLLNLSVITCMYSYFLKTSLWKKNLLVLLTLPVTYVNNMLRISLSGFYILFNGYNNFSQFHEFIGIVFYMISIVLVFAISNLMQEGTNEG